MVRVDLSGVNFSSRCYTLSYIYTLLPPHARVRTPFACLPACRPCHNSDTWFAMHRFDKRHPSPRPPNHGPWSAEGSTVRGCFVSSSTSHQGLASYPTTHRLGVQHQQRDRRWSGHIASSSSSSGSGSAMSVSLRYDTNNGTVGGLAPSSGRQLSDRTMPTVTVLDGIEGSGYYLDRGNGQVTRLIPADVLPQLGDLPAREMYHPSMVVLGTPIGDRPNMLAGVNGAVTIKVLHYPKSHKCPGSLG